MKLLALGLSVLVIASFTGYIGSYLYDSQILSRKFVSSKVSSQAVKLSTEVNNKNDAETSSLGSANFTTDISRSGSDVFGVTTQNTHETATQEVATPTSTPLLPVSSTVVSKADINLLIERYAVEFHVESGILRHLAECESGFNPLAVNKSRVGLYQFSPSIWRSNRNEMGTDSNLDLRYDASESIRTAAYILSKGKRWVWPVC